VEGMRPSAWYAQTWTQALPVRSVRTVFIIPGPKYVKNRKAIEGAASAGDAKTVQASHRCMRVYVRPPRITVLAVDPESLEKSRDENGKNENHRSGREAFT